MTRKSYVVYGGGGHGRVLISSLIEMGASITGFVDQEPKENIFDVPWIGHEITPDISADNILILGVGGVMSNTQRDSIFNEWAEKKYDIGEVIHPSAIISPTATLGTGIQVLAGAVIQAGATIGNNVLINTRAVVEHDCLLEQSAVVSPSACLCGNVMIRQNAYIGAGATIIQKNEVGRDATVAAGAVVINNVSENSKVAGVPAQPI